MFARRLVLFFLSGWMLIAPLSAQAISEEIYDPFEKVNRATFYFNDKVDSYLLEPVAKGYVVVVPEIARQGVTNFFSNLRFPQYLVSDLVRLEFSQALSTTGRFAVNTTIGIGGLIDFASHMGLPDRGRDFGLALAYHGVPPGPYIVLPFLGPSNVRDSFGLIVDTFLDPLYYVNYTGASGDLKRAIDIGGTALNVVSTRARLLDTVSAAKAAAIDYYGFTQGAYYQYRRGLLGLPTTDYNDEDEIWFEGEEPFLTDEPPAIVTPMTVEGRADDKAYLKQKAIQRPLMWPSG
jgi:phospholipid-binding lipoprotein MlaA